MTVSIGARTGDKLSAQLKIIYSLLFLLSSFAGVLLFSQTTSPLYSDVGYDSAMFQTIGKYWVEGTLPYTGLFDHKGPIIFLINAIGYAVCGRGGVFILQVVFLALGEAAAYSLMRERFPKRISLIAALLLPLLLAANWEEGNTTEEYILPLLFLSYHGMLRWCAAFSRGEYDHAPRFAAVYGLCFAFALLTRVTNALGVCVGTAFIAVTLIVRGRWKNLLQNAAAFLAAALLPTAAFCIYFAAHGALYDMWYGTLLFNFDYSANSSLGFVDGVTGVLVLARRYFAGLCLIAAALTALITGKKRSGLFWLCVSLVNTLFMFTLNGYAHYGICLLPFLYIAWALLRPESKKNLRARLSAAAALAMLALAIISSGLKIYKTATEVLPPQAYENYGDDYNSLIALIPEDGRSSFVAFDCPRRLYLDADIRPAFRFFTLQQWMSVNSPAFAETLREEFESARIEWVLTLNIYSTPLVTSDIIEENYTLYAQSENGIYRLYRLDG